MFDRRCLYEELTIIGLISKQISLESRFWVLPSILISEQQFAYFRVMKIFVCTFISICLGKNIPDVKIECFSEYKSLTEFALRTYAFLSESFFDFIISHEDSILIRNAQYRRFDSNNLELNKSINNKLDSNYHMFDQKQINIQLAALFNENAIYFANKLISLPNYYQRKLNQEDLTLSGALLVLHRIIYILTEAFTKILKLDQYISTSISNNISKFLNSPWKKEVMLKILGESYEECLKVGINYYLVGFIESLNSSLKEAQLTDHLNMLLDKEKSLILKNKELSEIFKSYKENLLNYLEYEREQISMVYNMDTLFSNVRNSLKNNTFSGLMFSLVSFVSKEIHKKFQYFDKNKMECDDMTSTLVILNKVKYLMMDNILTNYRNISKYIFSTIMNKFQLYILKKEAEIEKLRLFVRNHTKIVILHIFDIFKQVTIENVLKLFTELK